MKKQILHKVFALVGFLFLAFIALNMNACNKKKNDNGNPYGQYGQYGFGGGYGSNLGQYFAAHYNEMALDLTFVTNGQQVGASGYLYVMQYNASCAVPAGTFSVTTIQPGQYSNGDFQGIQMVAQNSYGLQLTIEGWLTDQVDSQGRRRMFVNANIPGCPTVFN